MAPEVVKHHPKNITAKISQMLSRIVEDEIILKTSREKMEKNPSENVSLS